MATAAPDLKVIGLDITPDMVNLANHRAEVAGLAGRVHFEVGDVGAMPFADAQFDLVVTTFSMHHWRDPARGLAEIQRVLKPGGVGCIYDISGWILDATHEKPPLSLPAAIELLGNTSVETIWGIGPVRVVERVCWQR